jgi:Mg2+ and Co2+ transporter CorA
VSDELVVGLERKAIRQQQQRQKIRDRVVKSGKRSKMQEVLKGVLKDTQPKRRMRGIVQCLVGRDSMGGSDEEMSGRWGRSRDEVLPFPSLSASFREATQVFAAREQRSKPASEQRRCNGPKHQQTRGHSTSIELFEMLIKECSCHDHENAHSTYVGSTTRVL